MENELICMRIVEGISSTHEPKIVQSSHPNSLPAMRHFARKRIAIHRVATTTRAILICLAIGPASRTGAWQAFICHVCVAGAGVSFGATRSLWAYQGGVHTQSLFVAAVGEDAVSRAFDVCIITTQAVEVAELAGRGRERFCDAGDLMRR